MNTQSLVRPRIAAFLLPLLAGGLALALYVSTAAPWLTWAHNGADGGDLITAAMTWGVPHPSGYPTYCLLGRLFALLPLGSVAHRFSLFSATAAALAVGLLCALSLRWLRPSAPQADPTVSKRARGLIALGAALAFAAGPTLWSQAVIAEVYALGALFWVLAFYLAARDDLLARWTGWGLLGLVLGLGLGAHLTLVLLLPGLAVLLWPSVRPKRVLALAVGLLLGLSVYAYLPLAARNSPPVNWGNPRTWGGFWWVISGRMYQHFVLSLPLRYLPSRLGAWVNLWVQQVTWPGVVLAVFGLWSWAERGERRRALATVLPFVLYSLYAVTYDTTDSYVYLIPTYALTALWMAEGLRAILTELAHNAGMARRLQPVALALFLALPLWLVPAHYAAANVNRDHTAAEWVQTTLTALPPGALLITGEDRHTFTLDYVQWVEGRRPDVIVVDGELLAYPWYIEQLARRYPDWNERAASAGAASLEDIVQANLGQRSIFLSSPRPSLAELYRVTPQGSLWSVAAR